MSQNSVHLATKEELRKYSEEIVDVWEKVNYSHPKVNQQLINKQKTIESLLKESEESDIDYWLVFDKNTNQLIGTSKCKINDGTVSLLTVKILREFFKTESNAALIFRICEYYLNDRGLRYISDGERSIRHITNYQSYLVSVIGFRYASCKLHIVYHPVIRPIVNTLYHCRKLIFKIGRFNSFVYNLSSILKQEEIARKFRENE